MLLDAKFNFASNSHRTSLKLNESQQLERKILRNYNLKLSTSTAPIVKTLPSYISDDSQHALELLVCFSAKFYRFIRFEQISYLVQNLLTNRLGRYHLSINKEYK